MDIVTLLVCRQNMSAVLQIGIYCIYQFIDYQGAMIGYHSIDCHQLVKRLLEDAKAEILKDTAKK